MNTNEHTEQEEKKMEIQLPVSLRDYFAATAMNQVGWHGDVDSLMACAKECYMIADAMMKARVTPNE
jgi:hypothetical protein